MKEGEKTLGLLHKNDAESVLVKAGCTFRGQVALLITTYLIGFIGYRAEKKSLQNIFKLDPGRARQSS